MYVSISQLNDHLSYHHNINLQSAPFKLLSFFSPLLFILSFILFYSFDRKMSILFAFMSIIRPLRKWAYELRLTSREEILFTIFFCLFLFLRKFEFIIKCSSGGNSCSLFTFTSVCIYGSQKKIFNFFSIFISMKNYDVLFIRYRVKCFSKAQEDCFQPFIKSFVCLIDEFIHENIWI